jgi:hypothetical protein
LQTSSCAGAETGPEGLEMNLKKVFLNLYATTEENCEQLVKTGSDMDIIQPQHPYECTPQELLCQLMCLIGEVTKRVGI